MLEIVSVHFAKCGGTSFSKLLSSHFGETLYLDHAHDPVNPMQREVKPSLLGKEVRAVHGHIRPDLYPLDRNTILTTFLRDPVRRILSGYFFWKSIPPHGNPNHDVFMAENSTIYDFANSVVGQPQQCYFSNFDMRRFDYIGRLENFENGVIQIERLLGVQFEKLNKLNENIYPEQYFDIINSEESVNKLRSILKIEYDFYEKHVSL